MNDKTIARGLLFLLSLVFIVMPVAADYTGNELAMVSHGTIAGDLVLVSGDSKYSGEIAPGGTYSVTYPVTLPANAVVKNATVYLSYTWSHAGTTGVAPKVQAESGVVTSNLVRSYADRKGSPPYDYPSGLLVYDVSGQVKAGTPLTFTAMNTATDAGVAFNGAVLLVIFETGGARTEYWVAEGADMLYAYEGVTAEQATTRIVFEGLPANAAAMDAHLLSVVPSGNKGQNRLDVNGHTIQGVFNGHPYADLAMNRTDLRGLVKAGTNTVTLSDQGDYLVPGVMVLRLSEADSGTPVSTKSPAPIVSMFAGLGVVALAHARRCRVLGRSERGREPT
jgi:hypothetical protein